VSLRETDFLIKRRTTKKTTIRKDASQTRHRLVSVILIDWSCRERFHALEWLNNQDASRDDYEIIWVELFDRTSPEVMEKADLVITCGQTGLYHKHKGYNEGLIHAKGKVITVCDSDAVFPRDFISSIIAHFNLTSSQEGHSLLLMHHEKRTTATYPEKLATMEDLGNFPWAELSPNVGACMSVLREDAIRFGGFDEHGSFRGYLCGPYDLGWRLVNAGIKEVWNDEEVCLWHFAHPGLPGYRGRAFSWKLFREMIRPHVDHHALRAVEAFSSGRLLPLRENAVIHRERLERRRIGTSYEARYALLAGPKGFSIIDRLKLFLLLLIEPLKALRSLEGYIDPRLYRKIEKTWYALQFKKRT
jgi:hypothetical protein